MPNYFAPKSDTVVFEGRPHTEAHLLPATGQCAMSKSSEVVAMITSWLRAQFTDFTDAATQPAEAMLARGCTVPKEYAVAVALANTGRGFGARCTR